MTEKENNSLPNPKVKFDGTFLDFLESDFHVNSIATLTLVRWMKSGELTAHQYSGVQAEVLKRKGLY